MKTAVIHSYNGMGDLIWHLPYIHVIAKKTKEKKVILFSKKTTNAKELLKSDPLIEKIIDLDDTRGILNNTVSFFKILNSLKKNKIKNIWIFHESIKYALASLLARVSSRFGYGYGIQRIFLSKKKIMPEESKNERPFEKARIFVMSHGFKKKDIVPKFFISKKEINKVKIKFNKHPKPWISMSITNKARFKRWPYERFSELIDLISNAFKGTIFVVGAPNEKKIINAVIKNSTIKKNVINSTFPIHENAVIMRDSNIFIGLDSGSYNLSALLGTPSYGIMGASPPLHHLPTYKSIISPSGPVKNIVGADKIPRNKGMESITAKYVFDCLKKQTNLFK